jgi:hypothetical protein
MHSAYPADLRDLDAVSVVDVRGNEIRCHLTTVVESAKASLCGSRLA